MRRPVDTVMRWWRSGRGNSSPQAASPPMAAQRKTATATAIERSHKAKRAAAPAEPPWFKQWDLHGVPRSLTYPTTTLGRMLDQTADRFGDTIAVVYQDRTWTYGELRAEVNRMAGGLARLGRAQGRPRGAGAAELPGVRHQLLRDPEARRGRGQRRPAHGLDDLQHLIIADHAARGDRPGPAAPRFSSQRAGSTVEHWVWVSLQSYQACSSGSATSSSSGRTTTKARAATRPARARHARQAAGGRARQAADARAEPAATAVLQPTSGTTGTLKLAQLSHRNLLANAMQVATLMWWSRRTGARARRAADVPRLRADDRPDQRRV